jgi:tRNA (mo5U34)-methyltransferase
MTARAIGRAGGFRFTVEIPDGLAARIKRLVGRTSDGSAVDERGPGQCGQLVIGEPRSLRTVVRDPAAGLAFIQARVATLELATMGTTDPSNLRHQVDALPWYHTIRLGDGVTTQGAFDHDELVAVYGIPESLAGRTVLDVAAADGYWSFEFERRGGRVTALDIATTDEVDLPEPVRSIARERGLVTSLRNGFDFARTALGSDVVALPKSVYDLEPGVDGVFDFVHAGDVLVHLREPLRALERMRAVCGDELLLSDVIDPALDGDGLTRYLGGWRTAGWWLPSLDTLAQMVLDAGFRSVELVTTYMLAVRGTTEGPWRAVLRARV